MHFVGRPADSSCAGCGAPVKDKAASRLPLPVAGGGRIPQACADDREPKGNPTGGSAGQPVKGVAMKRYALIIGAALGLMLSSGAARADWGVLTYSGYQPWWNIFAHRPKC